MYDFKRPPKTRPPPPPPPRSPPAAAVQDGDQVDQVDQVFGGCRACRSCIDPAGLGGCYRYHVPTAYGKPTVSPDDILYCRDFAGS